MKITKRQLKRIIREEKQFRQRSAESDGILFNALEQWVMMLDEEMGYDVPRDQLKAEVLNFVDGYFEDSDYAAEQAEREAGLAQR